MSRENHDQKESYFDKEIRIWNRVVLAIFGMGLVLFCLIMANHYIYSNYF